MQKHYIVKWEIDVEAENELEAAREARRIQLDPASIATVFDVFRITDKTCIDLEDYKEE